MVYLNVEQGFLKLNRCLYLKWKLLIKNYGFYSQKKNMFVDPLDKTLNDHVVGNGTQGNENEIEASESMRNKFPLIQNVPDRLTVFNGSYNLREKRVDRVGRREVDNLTAAVGKIFSSILRFELF